VGSAESCTPPESDDPAVDPTVLSEFRDRPVRQDLVRLALDTLVERLVDQGLVKAGAGFGPIPPMCCAPTGT
jgi:hypothetical protein